MNYSRKIIVSFVVVFLSACIGYHVVDAKTKEDTSTEQIAIELDYIPEGIKPGEKPITLSRELLAKLLIGVSNPRLMTLADAVDDDELSLFWEGGFTFVLKGDFNRDGFADVAFVGKYDNPSNPEKNCFIAIVSIRGKKVVREFFTKILRDRIFLDRIINYQPKIDAIVMSYSIESDDCGYLFWTGKKWQYDECSSAF